LRACKIMAVAGARAFGLPNGAAESAWPCHEQKE
jgi:hypothetical protein